jgi:fatty-acyl-CoA synthase
MFHCNGWGGVYALTGMGGTHVVLRTVEGEAIYRLIEQEGVTFACMAPAVLRTILDYPDKAKHRITTRPRFTVAGAPPPAAFIERLETELGWEFIQIYGLTETAPLLTVCAPDHATKADDWARRARAGAAGLGVQIRVVDDDDRPVPQDDRTVGEVCARSNVVFKGYYEQPDQSDAAIRDGWFHTGDLVRRDADGFYYVVDRKKDMIISGSENIYPAELEAVLDECADIAEAAVVARPDEKWGEVAVAVVVSKPGAELTRDGVLGLYADRLARYKHPRDVVFVDALPRNVMGKILKFEIRELVKD